MVVYRSVIARILFVLGLIGALGVEAQAQRILNTTLTSVTQIGPPQGYWDMTGTGITSFALVWSTLGTVSAGTCVLQSSTDTTFGSPSTVISGQVVTSSGGPTALTAANANFLRVSCSAGTPIAGTGSVIVTLIGINAAGSGSVSITGSLPAGSSLIGKMNVVDGSNNILPTLPSGAALPASADATVASYETLVYGALTSAMTGTTSTSVIAGSASNYIYISSCSFSNDHASTDTMMKIQDGSGGTALWEGMVPHGGGNDPTFPIPLKVPTSGNGLFVVNVTTSSSTYASCNGFKSTISY